MLIVPTGTDIAVDPADALLIATRGDGSTLYLAGGGIIPVDASPLALAAELDEALFGEGAELTLWTDAITATGWTSPVYIAGWQVRSARPSAPVGSMAQFAGGTMQVTIPSLSVAELTAEIGATSPPWSAGGGGGGGGEAIEWDPEPTGTTNVTGPLTVVQSTAIAVPYPESAVEVVTLTVGITGTSTGDASTTVTIPLPRTCDAQTVAVAQGDPGGGALGASFSAAANGENLVVTFEGQESTGFGFWCVLQYESGGS